jgi:nucleoside-diphosphate-sugar epimerase
MKRIVIIGTNGMLSTALTQAYMADGNWVKVFGRRIPQDYDYSEFVSIDLCDDKIEVDTILDADMVIYAAGAGVQSVQKTNPLLMYQLNVSVPIDLTIRLKQANYQGVYISFGSYMEIGVNNEEGREFNEDEVVLSPLSVTNDYALSKRVYSRYIQDFIANYAHWHFILPNMFSYIDMHTGNRLIAYVLQYIKAYKDGRNPEPPSFSAGTQTRQYILLEEIKQVVDRAYAHHIPSGVYNIGGGEYLSIRKVIENLFKANSVPCLDSYFGKEVRRDNDVKSLCLDASKLKATIGFLPERKMCDILVY